MTGLTSLALWETWHYREDSGLAAALDAILLEQRVGGRLCHSQGDTGRRLD